jgi:undecaprenyl-diphosphatase
MTKNNQKTLYTAICVLAAFVLWTIAIQFIDVKAIGPQNSSVGFATLNQFIHNLTGVSMSLYTITDWLGLVPLGFAMGFALFGFIQWIKRKRILKVDYNILVLGGFYAVVIAMYIFFELYVVNYRPILINGILEASYPSSTTMLVMCIMPTAIMQFNNRIKNETLKKLVSVSIIVFILFMVIGRILSGVHWITDIIGGALLSFGLVMLYFFVSKLKF